MIKIMTTDTSLDNTTTDSIASEIFGDYRSFSLAQDIENPHVAILTLNRDSEYNSLNHAFWQEFTPAIKSLDISGEIRALIIQSTGKHFCAGIDLNLLAKAGQGLFKGESGRQGEHVLQVVKQLQQCFSALEALRFPVLCAVQGGCIGGGFSLLSATDCRYATADAFFTLKETDIGMTADLGALQRLPKLMPIGLTKELAYTGRKLTATEAKDCGLVNAIYDDTESMHSAVLTIAREIASKSPLANYGNKYMLNYATDHSVAEGLEMMSIWQSGMFTNTDIMQSIQAKTTKKTAEFANLQPTTSPFE